MDKVIPTPTRLDPLSAPDTMAPAPKKRITSRRDAPWTVAELTGFTVELWARICRLKAPECLRDKPAA